MAATQKVLDFFRKKWYYRLIKRKENKEMPSVYELIFWICLLIGACGFGIVIFGKTEPDLYVTEYELDRINGGKY